MRKVAVAMVGAALVVAGGAGPASAGEIDGPCETQRSMFEKYNIEMGMHNDQLEYAYTTACSVTG